MPRLTFEGKFCDISMCRENPCPYNGMCSQRQTWERLKAYEDAGLEPEDLKKAFNETAILKLAAQALSTTPDHLRDLLQAEQDGRLHITPAFVRHNGDSGLHEVPYKPWMAQWIATGTKFWLTREEAEAALAQKGGDLPENRTD